MGLGTPPQPAFGEAVSVEGMSTFQPSDCEPPRDAVVVSEKPALKQAPAQPELTTCDSEVHAGFMGESASELAILFHNGTFQCPLCPTSKVFTRTSSYRDHRVKFHKLPRYVCVVCSATFDILSELTTHMLKENHPIKCPTPACPHDFFRPGEATTHHTLRHKDFMCIYCGASLKGRLCLKNHLKVHHATEIIDFVPASSLVETSLNSSFDDHSPGALSEQSLRADARGNSFYEATVLPDSKSSSVPRNAHLEYVLLDSSDESNSDQDTMIDVQSRTDLATRKIVSSVTVVENMQSGAESSTRGSDTNSVSAIGNVQSVTELEISTRDSDGDSVVQLFRNPFHEESVVFGPGAEELFEGPRISSTPDQSNGQWMGHDVDMYHAMSEKHKKIYRFNCGKCACSFRNKEMFKKHSRVHEHICKYCFKKFYSVEDFKMHQKTHVTAKKTLVCQICGHKPTTLKNLMAHEMWHRLSSAFCRKIKELAKMESLSTPDKDLYKCSKCNRLIKGLTSGIRHEVWHEWSRLWTSYVEGRVYSKTFKAEDAKEFKETIESQLKARWKHRAKSGQGENDSLTSEEFDLVDDDMDEVVNEAEDDEVEDELNYSSSTKNSNTNDKTDSETESNSPDEGINIAVNGWMSYWRSYLGLSDKPPRWVTPILTDLRSKWKDYHMEEQDLLYKQMDQIAFLIRAQRNEVLPGEGPRVVLKRIPNVSMKEMMTCESANKFPKAKVVLVRMPDTKVKEILLHESSLKQSTDLESCSSSTPLSSYAVCKTRTSMASKDSNAAPSGSKAHAIKSALTPISNSKKKTGIVGPKSRIVGLKTNCKRTLALDSSDNEEDSRISKIVKPNTSIKLASPKASKTTCNRIGRPVVILDKLDWPLGSTSTFHVYESDSKEAFANSLSTLSESEKVNSLIKSSIGNKSAPRWAIPLLETVFSSSTLSEKEKQDKILQILILLKAECEGAFNSVPYVKLSST